jgi:AcrR family transcriptional regulator
MPKLSQEVIAEKKSVIESAAKELFIKQGFHATSMRDIAKTADVSIGNLYNYYETKEQIFESIIGNYLQTINSRLKNIFAEIENPLEPTGLLKLGELVKNMIDNHQDFWLLMYIDVLEFDNQHFRLMFDGLSAKLSVRFANEFNSAKAGGLVRPGIDPAVAYTAVYMQFFNYFLVEKLFGGNSHFGLSDEDAIKSLTDIFCFGVLNKSSIDQ